MWRMVALGDLKRVGMVRMKESGERIVLLLTTLSVNSSSPNFPCVNLNVAILYPSIRTVYLKIHIIHKKCLNCKGV